MTPQDEKILMRWVINQEGGDTYTDDPNDPGGATRYGISLKRNPDLQTHPELMGRYQAEAILYDRYFIKSGAHLLTPGLALMLFGGAVNQGVKGSIRRMQRSINRGTSFPMLAQDGLLGPQTIQAYHKVSNLESEHRVNVIQEMNAQRATRYGNIGVNNPTLWRTYGKGWMNRLSQTFAMSIELERESDEERFRKSRELDR
jgi:lysozyme family protein